MTRTITLTGRSLNELTGRHAQVAAKITGSVEATELRKACRSLKPKRFRAIVRELAAARVIKVKAAR